MITIDSMHSFSTFLILLYGKRWTTEKQNNPPRTQWFCYTGVFLLLLLLILLILFNLGDTLMIIVVTTISSTIVTARKHATALHNIYQQTSQLNPLKCSGALAVISKNKQIYSKVYDWGKVFLFRIIRQAVHDMLRVFNQETMHVTMARVFYRWILHLEIKKNS